jgi:hypothetical protein
MIELDGQLTTDDMVFAVVLCLNGYHPLMDRNARGVVWILEPDEEVEDFVKQYQRGEILIEPRRFAREWAAMRKDVYSLMGVGNQSRGSRVARPADHHA